MMGWMTVATEIGRMAQRLSDSNVPVEIERDGERIPLDIAGVRIEERRDSKDVFVIVVEVKGENAETRRNCDVGTAEEQYERYRKQCKAQDCCDCPVHARWDFRQTGSESCQLVWAQMPYTAEGEAKG